jgi:KDO2-lipid IV(A) lauroyltransferase
MNQEACFYLGAEAIAKMTKFPVLFAQCTRRSHGHYRITFHEVARPPHAREGHDIIDRYVALAEQFIQEEPESWLWSNRRWKRNRAEEEARARAESGDG